MYVRLEQAKHAITCTRCEEFHRYLAVRVGRPLHPERHGVALADDIRNPRAEAAPVEEMQWLNRNEGLARVGELGILRAEEVGAQHDDIEDGEHKGASQCEVVLAETPPNEGPVGGYRDPFFCRC